MQFLEERVQFLEERGQFPEWEWDSEEDLAEDLAEDSVVVNRLGCRVLLIPPK